MTPLNIQYFLIPLSNGNNLIYLRSSEWGKHDKNNKFQVVASCVLKIGFRVLSF